jgi:hypothetical protein
VASSLRAYLIDLVPFLGREVTTRPARRDRIPRKLPWQDANPLELSESCFYLSGSRFGVEDGAIDAVGCDIT